MENKNTEIIKKVVLICLAGCFIGVGVGMILYANIGGDTVTVFQDGMHMIFRCSYGQASRIYNGILILTALLVARKYFGAGTVLSALITSFAIDLSFNVFTGLGLAPGLAARFVIFLAGQAVYTAGLSLLIRCRLGMNGLDSLLYFWSDRSGWDYKYLRLTVDLLLTLTGWLMGGVVGIGTVISVISTGVMIDFFVRVGKKHA